MSMLRFALAAGLAAAQLPAQAVEYSQFQADKSQLTFVSKQMGVPVEGRFRQFNAAIAFDPAKAAVATARLEVALASIDAGSKDADDEVAGKSWFNVKSFPTATFVSTGVKPLGGDRYEVAGKLTIKGKTQDLVAPATFRREGGNGVFDGSFTLKRLAFGIGEGPWSDIGTVADDVQIRFHIVATPRK